MSEDKERKALDFMPTLDQTTSLAEHSSKGAVGEVVRLKEAPIDSFSVDFFVREV